jgi:stage IV sporulation protein FB
MFGIAGETAFDLRFNLFGIPIRIHPVFWISAAMMRWNPERLDLVVLGVICVFVTVLIHELGHALVLRHYGWPSEIVLYFLGGYATATRLSTWRQIWSLAAGPLAGLSFSAIVYGALILLIKNSPSTLNDFPAVYYVFNMLLFSGIIVNLMNLIPTLPLDGGQIMATLVTHYGSRGRQATELVLKISIGAAGAVALWCAFCSNTGTNLLPKPLISLLPPLHREIIADLQPDPQFLMIFFGILCAQSVINFNQHKAW